MVREYKVRPQALGLLKKNDIPLECPRCHKPLEVGQRVVRVEGTKRGKVYHRSCYYGMFMDIP
ncbi:MAG: hypothetical protein OEY47_06690 [Candidatus Bathyarchaeota archaeon]|nr:hypothetical protein [Candidatus Bathyarchaeota archaeon]